MTMKIENTRQSYRQHNTPNCRKEGQLAAMIGLARDQYSPCLALAKSQC